MNIKKRRIHDEDAMAAMNDIMFFLMLFFLIISSMANPNVIRLLLPKADNASNTAQQPTTVSVTEDLRYYINTKEVTLADLEASLVNATQSSDNKTVVIRLEKSVPAQNLVNIMSIGVKYELKMVMAVTK